ncbi:sensor histidine kinase [Micromonospora sp. MW-13]|uniref:sensor histidine kinase n=1 Tax=Micromonospora sp. MW-13 TaxID=2094022 RepID=UPI001A9CBFD6|nr:histidine kinase [Micromonospora sp. MW-13]
MVDEAIEHGTGLTGFRRYTWWTLTGAVVSVLVLLTGDWLLGGGVPAWARGAGGAALAVTVFASVVLLNRRLATVPGAAVRGRPTGWLFGAGTGAAVLGAIQLAYGEYGLWAVAPAMVVAIGAAFLSARGQRALVAGAVAAAPVPGTLVCLRSGEGDLLYAAAFPLGLLLFTAWTTLGPLWAWDVAGQLHQARRLAAELAVKDERLRFAADLHDIQGHHLQVIAVKSELAARLAEVDPARAAAEMRQVRQLSTDALQETRALVQGYRRTTLEEEMSNATRVLAAADIDARMDLRPTAESLSASARHLLGLVMREATTNVLRHSRAARADVEYRVDGGRAHLRVSNDGAVDVPGTTTGTGLATLAERLTAAGGDLTWRHDGERFVVAAGLPVGAA